ncbi:hypothetical protein AKJ16_DCAP09227 [Drosera capensis]
MAAGSSLFLVRALLMLCLGSDAACIRQVSGKQTRWGNERGSIDYEENADRIDGANVHLRMQKLQIQLGLPFFSCVVYIAGVDAEVDSHYSLQCSNESSSKLEHP